MAEQVWSTSKDQNGKKAEAANSSMLPISPAAAAVRTKEIAVFKMERDDLMNVEFCLNNAIKVLASDNAGVFLTSAQAYSIHRFAVDAGMNSADHDMLIAFLDTAQQDLGHHQSRDIVGVLTSVRSAARLKRVAADMAGGCR